MAVAHHAMTFWLKIKGQGHVAIKRAANVCMHVDSSADCSCECRTPSSDVVAIVSEFGADCKWHNQDIMYDFRAQLEGTGSRSDAWN